MSAQRPLSADSYTHFNLVRTIYQRIQPAIDLFSFRPRSLDLWIIQESLYLQEQYRLPDILFRKLTKYLATFSSPDANTTGLFLYEDSIGFPFFRFQKSLKIWENLFES